MLYLKKLYLNFYIFDMMICSGLTTVYKMLRLVEKPGSFWRQANQSHLTLMVTEVLLLSDDYKNTSSAAT